MLLFVDYVETKQGMSEALNSIVGGTSKLYAISTEQMREAIRSARSRYRERRRPRGHGSV